MMFAVILERCSKSLKECFGVKFINEIPFFDANLEEFINRKLSVMNLEEIYKFDCDFNNTENQKVLKQMKKMLSKEPQNTVLVTYSDVCFCDEKIVDFIEELQENCVVFNAKNEAVFCFIKCVDFIGFLSENMDNLPSVFHSFEKKILCDVAVEIIDKPLIYKGLCNDTLSGKIPYRLPEIAQGIYASSNIPKGDFVLIPPVYFGENVQIEKGCVIGPGTIILDGALIAENTCIRNSFLSENIYISSGCHIESSLLSCNVVLRRNSVVFDSSVLCHDVTVGEESIVEKGSLIRSFSKADEHKNNFVNYKIDETTSTAGFYGYTPEKAALLGAAVGMCFDMPKIAVASDGELNSTALKLAFLGGLITTGASCYDFGNTFFSSLHYYMTFCELDFAAFISGNDTGTVISIFKKGETSLSKADYYNIKGVISSGDVIRCSKNDCKNIRQIHGMQRMYIQNLTKIFDESAYILPVFNCDNKKILNLAELAATKIGFKNAGYRVEFSINPWGTKASAQSDGVIYPHSKLLEIVSFFARKQRDVFFNEIYLHDAVILCFYILKILNDEKLTLKQVVDSLPRFYVAQKNIDNPRELRVIAADLSKDNKVEFRKDEIYCCDGLNTIKINEIKKGTLSLKAKSLSMEVATEIIENLTKLIIERGSY